MFYFHPELWGSDPIWLPHILQMGWFNHHLEKNYQSKWQMTLPHLPSSNELISWSRDPPGYPSSRGRRLQEGGRFFSTPISGLCLLNSKNINKKPKGDVGCFFVYFFVFQNGLYIKHPKRNWILIFVCSFWHTICSHFATFIWRWVFSCIIVFLDQDLQVVYCLSCGSKVFLFPRKIRCPNIDHRGQMVWGDV